ncbi:major facilitator superfamily transporter [Colletotrichum tofieldiae]|nr:major facilitator superfamily transporter [Colletotrichum tofieldiae]
MEDDKNPVRPESGGVGEAQQRPSLDDRASSDFLGEERARISIFNSDSDERTAASPDLDDKNPLSSSSEEDDDDGEGILPASLTEAWEEKAQLSKDYASAAAAAERKEMQCKDSVADENPLRRSRASSAASRCSHCGHHRRESVRSSITLGHGPQSPTEPHRNFYLQRPASLSLFPRTNPTSPSGAQRAFPLAVKRVPSQAVSDVQTFHSAREERGVISEPHSETASIMSSIFATPLRHLASNPSLKGSLSAGAPPSAEQRITPVTEQRHPAASRGRLSRTLTRRMTVSQLETLKAEKRDSALAQTADEKDEKVEWVEGWPLTFLLLGICLVVFLISVDRTILTTAIPYITSEFQSTSEIGWYGSAYLLTACAFQPVFGRVFMLFSVKWSYMVAMFMFLVGSLVCGVAPNSATLITWRWCFYMNLPIGAVTVAVFLLFFHPKRQSRLGQTFFDRFLDLDILGNVFLLGACVMLFLALEFTTQGEAWSSPRVIGLLSGAGATAVVFAAWQWWKQDGALIPPAIITQRTVAASCVAAFTTYGALLIHSYFQPIWFQAIKGESAISSGIDMIPYVATNAFFSLLSGIFVSIVGYFVPPAVVGGMIATAGCGVFRLLSQDTPTAQWIGFEVLVSAGFGMSIQQGFTAVQAVLPPDEISVGTAAVVASQSLGGAIFISVGNTLFQNHLLQASAQNMVPGVDIRAVLEGGATSFRTMVPASALPTLLTVYNEALRVAFTAAIPLAGVSAIAACFMEWKSVKGKKAG